MSLWIQLLLCLTVFGIAGWHLSINGDIIAKKTGLSGSWVGLMLLETAPRCLSWSLASRP